MKYYLIVGEASGDLHASNLMRALKEHRYAWAGTPACLRRTCSRSA